MSGFRFSRMAENDSTSRSRDAAEVSRNGSRHLALTAGIAVYTSSTPHQRREPSGLCDPAISRSERHPVSATPFGLIERIIRRLHQLVRARARNVAHNTYTD